MRITVLVWCLLAAVAAPRPGAAQGESEDVHLRNDCRLAAQVLRTGQPATHRAWALSVIARCESSGPAVLAELWRTAPATEAVLTDILVPSARLADRRIYTAVAEIARDRGAADLKRVYALQALAGYVAPGRGMTVADLLDPAPDSARELVLVSGDHVSQRTGTEPLPASVPVEVRQILTALIEGEPESRVGIAARRLLAYVLGQN